MSARGRLALLVLGLLGVRLGSALVVAQPGYTDAYYYAGVARRLAGGFGLSADFLWNVLEAAPGGAVPVPSHRFWMPLATVLQAIGIRLLPFLDAFRAAQIAEIAVACAIPVVAHRAARSLGATEGGALCAALLAGLGGAFAPGWVSLDAFAPAAVLGTLYFLAYRRAARGDAEAGALAGLLVGLLFLARAETALFGLPLLALLRRPATRPAGLSGSAVALGVGLAWLARDLSLEAQPDLIARSFLLVRYEDFFAVASPTWAAYLAAGPAVLVAKVGALATNALTFVFAFGLLLVPGIVVAIRARRADPAVRTFALLLGLIYLFESLGATLHSTRGSYFHSLAAFVPFGVALGVVGTAALLGDVRRIRLAAVAGWAAAAVLSAFAVGQWDAAFNAPYRARLAAVEAIPPGRFMAVDAAAWRWLGRRPVVVTPSDPSACAFAALSFSAAKWLVLEPVHFSAYDALYRGGPAPEYLVPQAATGELRIFAIDLRRAGELCTPGR